jgi:predicted transcriptional regulator of viral defense system
LIFLQINGYYKIKAYLCAKIHSMSDSHIQGVFSQQQGIATAQALRDQGINYYQLNQLIQKGSVRKLKRGLYKWTETDSHELSDVARMVPNGVFCLHSAAFFHGLTTFIPHEHTLAIPDKSKVALPPYPAIKLFYWDEQPYNIGIQDMPLDGGILKVYSPEKTVCDMIRFRRRVGTDTVKEVLRAYLNRPDRNISQLLKLAQTLKTESTLRTYLEVLV